jgi:hypothetical protein
LRYTSHRPLVGGGAARALASLFAAALLALAVAPPRAEAITDSWGCNVLYSAQTCWSGAGYRGWIEIVAALPSGVYRSEVCAKGRTEAQNTRTGAGNGCDYNTRTRTTCFSTAEPPTAAYFYWAGSGGGVGGAADARSPASRFYC